MTKIDNSTKYTLGFDSAVFSGSIALFSGADLLYSIESGVSRADTLLSEIQRVLNETGVRPQDLDEIAVSVGPGSFTGVRIAIATAFGLKRSLSAKCNGISVFDAITVDSNSKGRIPLLPLGRGQYLLASKTRDNHLTHNENKFELFDEASLSERINIGDGDRFVFPKYGCLDNEKVPQIFEKSPKVEFCEKSIAELLCERAFTGNLSHELSPIYSLS